MAVYTPSTTFAGGTLSPEQLLQWNGGTVFSQTATQVVLRIRDNAAPTAFPGDYDLVLTLSNNTVTAVSGRAPGSATVISSLTGLSITPQFSAGPPPSFENPNPAVVFAGADTFNTRAGVDILNGRGGADIFTYSAAGTAQGDHLNGGSSDDTVRQTVSVDYGTTTLVSIERFEFGTGATTATFLGTQLGLAAADGRIRNVTASTGADSLTVHGPAVDLRLLALNGWNVGVDLLTVQGTNGADILRGSAVRESILGGVGADTIEGFGGSDALFGGEGNDRFEFNAAGAETSDFIDGGDDTDTLVIGGSFQFYDLQSSTISSIEQIEFAGASSGVTLQSGQIFSGITTIIGSANRDLMFIRTSGIPVDFSSLDFVSWSATDIIRITGGLGNDNIVGTSQNDEIEDESSGNDFLSGGEGDDEIRSFEGIDTVDGGEGTDTLSFLGGPSVNINLALAGAQAVPGGSVTISNVENLIGGSDADILRGSDGDNLIIGSKGDDLLLAFAGNDTFHGDSHTDTLSFSLFTSAVTVSLALTAAQAVAGGSVTVSDVENLVGGSGADTLRGDNGANSLDGGRGNDTLVAFNGADTFVGGLDVDTLSFGLFSSAVNINLALAGAQAVNGGSVTVSSIENLVGGSGADTLRGDSNGNRLDGALGNDKFLAFSGADTFIGGGGTDLLSFELFASAVTMNLATTTAQAHSGGTVTLDGSIEDVRGGNGSDAFVGSAASNTFFAFNGSDRFDGGAGSEADTVSFSLFNSAVNINLDLAGAQAVNGGSVALARIENITGGNGNDTLRGSSGANRLEGGAGDDTFIAFSGADTYVGGTGNDTLSFAQFTSAVNIRLDITSLAQTVNGGSITFKPVAQFEFDSDVENLIGGSGADTLQGGIGANRLAGGSGASADRLIGAIGADTLAGGGGADTFVYRFDADSTLAARDTITDFDDLDVGGDIIDLAGVMPEMGLATFQLQFIGTEAFSSTGQLRFFVSGGDTFVEANTSGDTTAELSIRLSGVKSMVAEDFIL